MPDIRQVYMKPDGTLTDIPARDAERPQLEKQGNLLLWATEKEKEASWHTPMAKQRSR